MKYKDQLTKAMTWLGQQENTIFLGQSVEYQGTGMFSTLEGVPMNKKKEMPVCEDLQQGICNGLALMGKIPISIFPRWNFLLLATNQIINHLDKITKMSSFCPKVIIRTAIGSERPLHPQHQHVGDYTEAFRLLAPNIEAIRLDEPQDIFSAYEKAYHRKDGKSTILVEWGDFYNEK